MAEYRLIWSPIAKLSCLNILEYLQENWYQEVVDNFIDRTEEVLGLINQNPFLYIYSAEVEAYKCLITKQVSLLYRIADDRAELPVFGITGKILKSFFY